MFVMLILTTYVYARFVPKVLITGILRIPSLAFTNKLIRASTFACFVNASAFTLFITFVEMVRFELMTPCLQGRCSPN